MAHCHAWKPNPKSKHGVGHRPGKCRTCWKPCFRKVDPGERVCSDCIDALSTHLDPGVRMSLIESNPPHEVLEMMVTDLDLSVQRAAESMLDHQSQPVEVG